MNPGWHGSFIDTGPRPYPEIPPMSQEQQPIRFAYWVPNVSGGLVDRKSVV